MLFENGKPQMGPTGRPEFLAVWLPKDKVQIHDTWYTTGLAGSGSNDYSVHPGVIGRRIEVIADLDRVQAFCDGHLVADQYAEHECRSGADSRVRFRDHGLPRSRRSPRPVRGYLGRIFFVGLDTRHKVPRRFWTSPRPPSAQSA